MGGLEDDSVWMPAYKFRTQVWVVQFHHRGDHVRIKLPLTVRPIFFMMVGIASLLSQSQSSRDEGPGFRVEVDVVSLLWNRPEFPEASISYAFPIQDLADVPPTAPRANNPRAKRPRRGPGGGPPDDGPNDSDDEVGGGDDDIGQGAQDILDE
eukprot:5958451-Pyramimonas_sp.AAC.1